jgi:hypothetical protein
MKHSILTIILLSVSLFGYGQIKSTTADADIKMQSRSGSKNSELANILQFQNIDYYDVRFIGQKLKGKYFSVYCKEIWNGEVRKIDTLLNSKKEERVGQIKRDTLSLTLLGSRVNDKLKLFFKFPMIGMPRKYDAIVSDDYNLIAIGVDMKIKFNENFPAFAFILPYIHGEWKDYCEVAKNGANVEGWGKKYNIKHYLIFEMKFEE